MMSSPARMALGFAFMREWITEKGDDAIAQALKDVTFVTGNTRSTCVFVDSDDVLQHLGINARGQLGESHHVAEHDGKLAAFAFYL